jgi:hypothetical protein
MELDRVTTRTIGLNLTRVEAVAPRIHLCAEAILQFTPETPKFLPTVGAAATIAQLNLVVHDYLATRNTESDSEVAALLTQLRRDLP